MGTPMSYAIEHDMAVKRVLLTAQEVAVMLSVSRARVYDLARTGVLPSVRLGRSIRFAVGELEWLLQAPGALRATPSLGNHGGEDE